MVQVEGEKTWTLHAPRSEAELLPRVSSGDFDPGLEHYYYYTTKIPHPHPIHTQFTPIQDDGLFTTP